ncbi:redoxin domain-containing protein [Candidatus Bipolaricaulota bacterium]|nr:redoxin domain-containing protein [Candidatus Bipolaricaulota bacterium]
MDHRKGVRVERIKVGAQAPTMVLPDQNKETVTLASLKGKRVLLSFHPLAWTGVCQRQMEALEMNVDVLAELNTVALGISVDPVPSKAAWAESIGVKRTKLLSDFWPHGEFAASLGLFRKQGGISERASIILDEQGVVRSVTVHPMGEAPDMNELLETLRNL